MKIVCNNCQFKLKSCRNLYYNKHVFPDNNKCTRCPEAFTKFKSIQPPKMHQPWVHFIKPKHQFWHLKQQNMGIDMLLFWCLKHLVSWHLKCQY